jgi:seryl-tRNA(Sec) selenium transferase
MDPVWRHHRYGRHTLDSSGGYHKKNRDYYKIINESTANTVYVHSSQAPYLIIEIYSEVTQ